MRSIVTGLLVCGLCSAAGGAEADLKALYESHQWFRLREAVAATSAPSHFYRGAVASAFHDEARARQELQFAIDSAPESDVAAEARRLLRQAAWADGYWRWGHAPSQQTKLDVVKHGHSTLHTEIKDDRIVIPVSIDGVLGKYILGTESQQSILGESEARRLGLATLPSDDRLTDGEDGVTGKPAKIAVANRVEVGKTVLRNAAFMILPDDLFPTGVGGIIGLQVILALERIRWRTDGTLEIGFRSKLRKPGEPNLCLDDQWLATEGELGNKRLFFGLDTGSQTTHLYGKFQQEFPDLVATGTAETVRDVGMTGRRDLPGVAVPELAVRVAGFDGIFRPAHVLRERTPYPWYHGNLAMDFVRQAHTVTIDFRSMILSIE